jgi:hypothetical protein
MKRHPGQASPSVPDFALLNPGYAPRHRRLVCEYLNEKWTNALDVHHL